MSLGGIRDELALVSCQFVSARLQDLPKVDKDHSRTSQLGSTHITAILVHQAQTRVKISCDTLPRPQAEQHRHLPRHRNSCTVAIGRAGGGGGGGFCRPDLSHAVYLWKHTEIRRTSGGGLYVVRSRNDGQHDTPPLLPPPFPSRFRTKFDP